MMKILTIILCLNKSRVYESTSALVCWNTFLEYHWKGQREKKILLAILFKASFNLSLNSAMNKQELKKGVKSQKMELRLTEEVYKD